MSFHAAVRPSVNCKQKERLEENSSFSEAEELDREQADVEEQASAGVQWVQEDFAGPTYFVFDVSFGSVDGKGNENDLGNEHNKEIIKRIAAQDVYAHRKKRTEGKRTRCRE